MAQFRCIKVRTAMGAYAASDGKGMPCRAFHVQLRNVEEQAGPHWGVADMMMTVHHECHFVEGQVYEINVG